MRTLARIAAALSFVAVAAAACNSSFSDPTLASQGSNLALPSGDDGGTGTGPTMMFVCGKGAAGDDGTSATFDCGAAAVTNAATFVAAMTPPTLAFNTSVQGPDFPYVESFAVGNEVNFWNYDATGNGVRNRGLFFNAGGAGSIDIDSSSLVPLRGSTPLYPINFGSVLTGYISVPASGGGDTVKTFAIGSNDGHYFAVQGCPATGTCTTANTVYDNLDVTGHALTFQLVKVVFPAAGGLFPFELAWYNATGNSGLELAWADGDQTGKAPTIDDTGTITNVGGFTLVPKTAIYAPDVNASLTIPPGTNFNGAGGTLTFTAQISNRGRVPAYPTTSAGTGLTFVLAVRDANTTVGTVKVNGTTVTPTVTVSAPNKLISVPFGSPSSAQLLAGEANAATITVAVAYSSAISNGDVLTAQGVVKAQGTDPAFLEAAAVVPPQSIWRLTDDPTVSGTSNFGNAPLLFGATDEGGASEAAFLFNTSAVAGGDDDSTSYTVNTTTAGAVAITSPTGTVSTGFATTVSGTGPASSGVRALLFGLAQAKCPAGAASSGQWSWDAAGQVCACSTTTNGSGAWSCAGLPLVDCPGASACYTAKAGRVDASGSFGQIVSFSFGTAAPTTTLTAPAAAAVLKTHAIKPTGVASSGLANASGLTVVAVLTGPGGTVTPFAVTSGSAGAWTYASTPIFAPTDGAYTVSAHVVEANGTDGASTAAVAFTVDTKPTITAPANGTLINTAGATATVTFSGSKVGDGVGVRVCTSATLCSAAAQICQSVTAGTGAWTCNGPVAASASPYTFYAYEIDANGGGSDASTTPVSGIIVSNGAATVNVANNAVFNFASGTSLSLSGTCTNGDNVTAVFLNGAAAWPTGPTQVKCGPTACAAGIWSCTATLPTTVSATGLTLRVSQSNGTSGPDLNVTGITVDLIKPAPAVITAPANGTKIKIGQTNPPVISGTGENGDTVAVTITRTGGGTVACVNAPIVVSGGNWTCNAGGTPLADGDYTITVSQTDAANNPQSAASTAVTFSIDQTAPGALTINAIGNANGFIGSPGALPTITGTGAEAGASLVVTVTGGATRTCTIASVATGGAWSCNNWGSGTNFPATAGTPYTATAVQTDSFANPSPASNAVTFTVDTVAPSAPTIDAPANTSFVTAATVAIKATPAEANGAFTIVLTDAGSNVVTTCTTAIGASATQQTCNSTGSLVNGVYTITATQTDRASNVGASATSTFTVDLGRSPTPVLAQPTSPTAVNKPVFTGSGFPGSSVTVKTSAPAVLTLCTAAVPTTKVNGVYPWTCTSTPTLDDLDFTIGATSNAAGAGASNNVSLQIRTLPTPTLASTASPTTAETKPTFTIGVAAGAAGKSATVFEGATAICTVAVPSPAPASVTCAPAGYPAGVSLAVGDHSLDVILNDSSAPPHRSLPSNTVAIAVLPPSPQLTAVASYGTSQPVLAGSGTSPGATVTIRNAADNSVLCTAVADPAGAFSCAVGVSPAGVTMADGAISISIDSTLAGKTSAAATATVQIHATPSMVPPTTPTKTTPAQLCVSPQAGVPAGSTVHVKEGAQTICSIAAQASGQSCCPPGAALSEGVHLLTATITFPPGGTSAASEAVELRIKTKTDVPTFSGPASGASVKGDVVVTGHAEPGATVAVSVDGGAPILATAGSDGTWSADAGTLNTGSHAVTAVATDSLGNTATSTTPLSFSVGIGGQVRGASTFGCSSTSSSGFAAWPLLAMLLLLRPRGARAARVGLGRKPQAASRKPSAAFAVAALLALAAPAARAQSIGLEHFKPASGGDGFFGTEGARPPESGDGALQVRVWMQGMTKPLVFLPDGGGEKSLISSRVGGWLSAQLHAAGNFSVAAQLPFLLSQQGDLSPLPRDVSGGQQLGGGIGDLRLTGRMGVLRQGSSPVDLAAQLSIDLPTAPTDRFMGDGSLQGEALLAAGRRLELASSAIDLLGNVFVRVRPSRELLGIKEGSEVGLRGGLAYLPESAHPAVPARLLVEVEGASFLRAGFAGGSVPSEWRAGLTYCVGRAFAFDLGAGGGLTSGIGAPAFRVLGAISFGSPACGHSMRADPVPARTRFVQPAPPPKAAPPPEAVVAPPMVAEAPPSLDTLPPVAPTEPARKRGTKKKTAAAEPALPELDALPPVPNAAPSSPPKAAEVAALPDLELPAPAADASAKKSKKLAMAAPPPELPSLDLPMPAAAPKQRSSGLARVGPNRIETARPIAFQGSTARLGNEGRRVLDDVARLLNDNPELRVEVAGHADTDANGGVAQARAQVVAAYLRSKGVSGDRLTVESYGASQPMVVGRSRSARAKNLRVELNLLKK